MTEAQGPTTQALAELTPASASIGTWLVKVHRDANIIPYSYMWHGERKQSQKIEVILLGEEEGSYCIGRARRPLGAKDDKALQALAAKFKSGSMWKMSGVTLMSENKVHLGSSVKVVVDLAKTTWSPVLQGTKAMPTAPAPVEQLSDIISVRSLQRCDVMCLLQNVQRDPKTRSTQDGERQLIEVAICDGSMAGEEPAKLTMTIWLPTTIEGNEQLTLLSEAFDKKEPVSFFGMYVEPKQEKDEVRVVCKTAKDFWWMLVGAQSTLKADRLRTEAQQILTSNMRELATQEDWIPQEAVDYLACPATRVNVQLLQAMVQRERDALPHVDEGGFVLFQLNCVRLIEPAPAEELKTKDGSRLFVPVRVIDDYGQMVLRMRESAALQASNLRSSEEFEAAVRKGGLRFPILSSIRVRVKKGASASASASDGQLIDAVIVEAAAQDIQDACRPNASLVEIAEASKPLGFTAAFMLVGALSDITRSPHAGLCVGGITSEFALALVAVKGQSDLQPIGQNSGGYRVVTDGLFEVALKPADSSSQGAPELSLNPVPGKFVSMCTLGNLTQFTLTPSSPNGATYCLALISSVLTTPRKSDAQGAQDEVTFIVDRVSIALTADDRLPYALLLEEMAKLAKLTKPDERPKRRAEWAKETAAALTVAKKARSLSREPTNTPLPNPQTTGS